MKALRMTPQPARAPELYGDRWLNSEPLSVRECHGRPVLLFFCDQAAPHSDALIPLINGIHALYSEYGMTCIGVHSPSFPFARDPRRVEQWVRKKLILFPVVTDNERSVLNAYRISSVPAVCLIDAKGDIYDTLDTGLVPERLERALQYLLRQSGYRGELPILINPAYDRGYRLLPDTVTELTAGYAHGALGNPEGYSPELAAEYRDPGLYVGGKLYAHGVWRAERDALVFGGGEGYLLCPVEGDETTILAEGHGRSIVRLELDGEPLRIAVMGDDVKKDRNGQTYIAVEEPRSFSVLKNNGAQPHRLTLIPSAEGTRIYLISTITFAGRDPLRTDDGHLRN